MTLSLVHPVDKDAESVGATSSVTRSLLKIATMCERGFRDRQDQSGENWTHSACRCCTRSATACGSASGETRCWNGRNIPESD